jgi:alpha-pyrone synthase
VLKSFGNMSSPTILFVLKGIWDDLKDDCHGKNIFSCAFGPGLTLESMLLQTHIRVPQDTRK